MNTCRVGSSAASSVAASASSTTIGSSCPPPRRARTCSPPSTGSSRWSPPGRCPRRSRRGCAGSTRSCATRSRRLPSLGAGSPQAYSVMATATDYLPEAVGGYLRLPRQFADNRPVDRGKSSLMVLIDQLDLLAATMDKVFDAVCRADADALVAHGQVPGGEVRVGLDRRGARRRVGAAAADARHRVGTRPARMPVGWVAFSRRPGGTPDEHRRTRRRPEWSRPPHPAP